MKYGDFINLINIVLAFIMVTSGFLVDDIYLLLFGIGFTLILIFIEAWGCTNLLKEIAGRK